MTEMGAPMAEDRWSRRSHLFLFLVIFAVGAWLRLDGATEPGLWIDEYGTWWVVAADTVGETWNRAWEVQGQSPLYYLLVRGATEGFGLEPATLRGFSLAFGIGLLLLGYALGRSVFRSAQVGLMVMAALGLHERLIYYSQEARPYALALFCAAASFLLYLRVLRGGGRGAQIAWLLATAATWYTHYLFGMVVLVQLLHLLTQRELTTRWRVWAGCGVALAIVSTPGLFQLAQVFGRRHSLDWIEDPAEGVEMLRLMVNFLDPLPLAAAAVAAVLLMGGGRRPTGAGAEGRPGLALTWFLVPFAICAFVPPLFDVTLAHHRYTLLAAPAAMLLVGRVLALPRRGFARDVAPLLVFTVLTALFTLLPAREVCGVYCYRPNHRWDEAAAALVAGYREGDNVLFASGFVEMDLLVRGEADDRTRAFAEWPLRAHLPPQLALHLYPLPYRASPGTLPALRSVLQEARRASRIWILGVGRTMDEVLAMISAHPQVQVTSDQRFGGLSDGVTGGVRLVLVTRT